MNIFSKKEAVAAGLKFYFTGRPCKHGHITQRHIHNSSCRECVNHNALKWARDNHEKAAANMRSWRAGNPEKDKITRDKSNARWRSIPKNREAALVYAARQYTEKKEEIKKQSREWRANNLERRKMAMKAWYANNKDHAKSLARNRKARMRRADGSHTGRDIREIFILQRGLCAYCRTSLEGKKHVDHIVPLILGGTNHRKNLQLLCPTCNLSKGPKDPLCFSRELGLLL